MKTILYSTLTIAAALVVGFCAVNLRAAETPDTTARIGTYDSRAVAYAWFWSARHQTQLHEMMQAARDARAAGDTNRFQELDAKLREHQTEMHREVFSTAPATGALAEIKDRLPGIQKAAGAAALVSKWDDTALKKFPDAEKADVTDALVREFITPTPQQQKVLTEIKTVTPLPLEQCEELIRKGEI
jgi:hypothetical protein